MLTFKGLKCPLKHLSTNIMYKWRIVEYLSGLQSIIKSLLTFGVGAVVCGYSLDEIRYF